MIINSIINKAQQHQTPAFGIRIGMASTEAVESVKKAFGKGGYLEEEFFNELAHHNKTSKIHDVYPGNAFITNMTRTRDQYLVSAVDTVGKKVDLPIIHEEKYGLAAFVGKIHKLLGGGWLEP